MQAVLSGSGVLCAAPKDSAHYRRVSDAPLSVWTLRRDAQGRLRLGRLAEEPDWSAVGAGAQLEVLSPDGILVQAEVLSKSASAVTLAARVGSRRTVWSVPGSEAPRPQDVSEHTVGLTLVAVRSFMPKLLAKAESPLTIPVQGQVRIAGYSQPEQDEQLFGLDLEMPGTRMLVEYTLPESYGSFEKGATLTLPLVERDFLSLVLAD